MQTKSSCTNSEGLRLQRTMADEFKAGLLHLPRVEAKPAHKPNRSVPWAAACGNGLLRSDDFLHPSSESEELPCARPLRSFLALAVVLRGSRYRTAARTMSSPPSDSLVVSSLWPTVTTLLRIMVRFDEWDASRFDASLQKSSDPKPAAVDELVLVRVMVDTAPGLQVDAVSLQSSASLVGASCSRGTTSLRNLGLLADVIHHTLVSVIKVF